MAHTIKGKKRLLNRVRRIRGQVQAVERALEEERDCFAVLQLITACRGAIGGLMSEVLEGHIRQHILEHDIAERDVQPSVLDAGHDQHLSDHFLETASVCEDLPHDRRAFPDTEVLLRSEQLRSRDAARQRRSELVVDHQHKLGSNPVLLLGEGQRILGPLTGAIDLDVVTSQVGRPLAEIRGLEFSLSELAMESSAAALIMS